MGAAREVDIVLRGHDQTGPATQSALANLKGFQAGAVKAAGGVSQMSAMVGAAVPQVAQLGGAFGNGAGMISDFLTQSKTAGLGAAAAFGGVGLAVAAVGLGIGALIARNAEYAKSLQDVKRIAADTLRSAQESSRKAMESLFPGSHATPELAANSKAMDANRRELEDLEAKRQSMWAAAYGEGAYGRALQEDRKIKHEMDVLRANTDELERRRGVMKKAHEEKMAQEAEDKRKAEDKAAAEKIYAENWRKDAEEEKQAAEEREQLAEGRRALFEFEARRGAYGLFDEEPKAAKEAQRPGAIEGRFLTRLPYDDPGQRTQQEQLAAAKKTAEQTAKTNDLLQQMMAKGGRPLEAAQLN